MFFWKLRFLWLQSIFAVCFPKFLGRTPTSLGRCKLMESLCLAGEMCFDPSSSSNGPMARSAWLFMAAHSSEIRGLHLTKCPCEILQKLLHDLYKKIYILYVHFVQHNFSPKECPAGLCWNISGHFKIRKMGIKLHWFSHT